MHPSASYTGGCQYESQQSMLAVYVNLKKKFVLVLCKSLGPPTTLSSTVWPVLQDRNCSTMWDRHVQLLSCEYRSKTGVHPCPITFQCLYGLLGWVVNQIRCGARIITSRVSDVFANDTLILVEWLEGLVLAVKHCIRRCSLWNLGHLGQDQSTGIWRLTGWSSAVFSCT